MFASATEAREQFLATTFAAFDFVVRDVFDNGEFMTGATVDLIVRGRVVETRAFTASSEEAPCDGFSAYGNGRSNNALTQALSFANAWVDAMENPYGSPLRDERALYDADESYWHGGEALVS